MCDGRGVPGPSVSLLCSPDSAGGAASVSGSGSGSFRGRMRSTRPSKGIERYSPCRCSPGTAAGAGAGADFSPDPKELNPWIASRRNSSKSNGAPDPDPEGVVPLVVGTATPPLKSQADW